VIFVGEKLTVVGFLSEEYEKHFENDCSGPLTAIKY